MRAPRPESILGALLLWLGASPSLAHTLVLPKVPGSKTQTLSIEVQPELDEAIYFGSFDPLHKGHLRVAQSLRQALGVPFVVFVPNRVTRGKPDALSFEERHRMVKLALRDYPQLDVLDADTIRRAFRQGRESRWVPRVLAEVETRLPPGGKLYHLMGTDSYLKLRDLGATPAPGSPRRVVVIRRPDYPWDESLLPPRAAPVLFLDLGSPRISSSEIRTRVRTGLSIEDLVPPLLAYWIQLRGFYRGPDPNAPLPKGSGPTP